MGGGHHWPDVKKGKRGREENEGKKGEKREKGNISVNKLGMARKDGITNTVVGVIPLFRKRNEKRSS